MPGKKVLPLSVFDVRSRSTDCKRDIRSEAEEKLSVGDHDFFVPREMIGNSVAKKKFIEITDMYKRYKYKFVTTADTQTLSEYCIAWSEYISLQKYRKKIMKDPIQFESWMKVESRIDKKNEVLIKLANLLYLTPGSRLKVHDVPDMKKDTASKVKEEMMFG